MVGRVAVDAEERAAAGWAETAEAGEPAQAGKSAGAEATRTAATLRGAGPEAREALAHSLELLLLIVVEELFQCRVCFLLKLFELLLLLVARFKAGLLKRSHDLPRLRQAAKPATRL